MATYAELNNNLDSLSLSKIKDILPVYLDDKTNDDKSLVDKLVDLTKAEIEFRDERAKRINITVSSFPYHKTLKDFDFSYQPTINKGRINYLATAIGMEAASQRISTYFINFAELMEKFKRAAKENRVEQVVKHYLKYSLLIIDEIGYLPVDRDSSYAFFQLIAARYEKRSTILTTNQPFSKWGEVFGDPVIANAIIDRLVHHSEVIKITGMSYRIKDKNIFEEDA